MIQKKQSAGGLLALVVSITLQSTSAATDASATSWLMSEAELATHRATMAALEGQAREDYRNAQYEQLKKRALEQGFELPADPPWSAAAVSREPVSPAPAGATGSTDTDAAAEAAARHAAMRDKLQARREALQKDSEASLERLQQAANAQQKQVDAQLQDMGMGTGGHESAAAPAVPPASMPEPAPVPDTLATPPVEAPVPLASPTPPTPPTPPAPPASVSSADMEQAPRFAPIEPAAPVMPSPDVPPPEMPTPEIASPDTPSPVMPPPEQDASNSDWQGELGSVTPPYGDPDAMTAYRNNMRTRFDEYMKERQAQMEEKARRQREQLEAAMEQNRSMRANRPPHPPYPYPAAPPAYGPRYPSAYPGYRTPYWQQ